MCCSDGKESKLDEKDLQFQYVNIVESVKFVLLDFSAVGFDDVQRIKQDNSEFFEICLKFSSRS